MQCVNCDTEYTADAKQMTLEETCQEVERVVGNHTLPLAVITGGEPFRQMALSPLCVRLQWVFSQIQIETNGAMRVPTGMPGSVHIVVSPKAKRVHPVTEARSQKGISARGHSFDSRIVIMTQPRRKRRRMEELLALKEPAIGLLRKGYSNRKVAVELDLDSHLVASWRREAGLPKSLVGGNRIDPELRKVVEEQIRNGATLTALAKRYAVGLRTMTTWKKLMGIRGSRNPPGAWKKRVDVSLSAENHAKLKALRDELHTLGELLDMAVEQFVESRSRK